MIEIEETLEFDADKDDYRDSPNQENNRSWSTLQMLQEPKGWDLFTEEVSWFIYDFFKNELNGYEKLLFYSYFINGKTFMEIAESADCSFQYIGAQIKSMEKRLAKRWKTKDTWRVKDDRK